MCAHTDTHTHTQQSVCFLQTEREGPNVSEIELHKHYKHITALKQRGYNGQGMWHAWREECIHEFTGKSEG